MNKPEKVPQEQPLDREKVDALVARLLEELTVARSEARRLEDELDRKNRELQTSNASLVELAFQVERLVEDRTEEEVNARAAAEAENAAKTSFLAAMSHEIRTPLNGVLGMASALADTELDQEQKSILLTLRESGSMLLHIVDDILDLSKVQEGKVEFEFLPQNIHRLISGACAQFEGRIQAKGICFHKHLEQLGEDGLWLEIDPTRFQQVLNNLLSNATKFTEQGEIVVGVDVEAVDDMHVRLSVAVRDTGRGMTDEQRARLFQPYVQADASIHRSHGGTGLGLAISQEICALMKGDLNCRSLAGEGSEFVASFLLRRCEPQVESEEFKSDNFAILSARRWRVLVAEDNRTNRLVMKHMLKSLGFELYWAKDGSEAVKLWRAEKPHLILMDVNMPIRDGLEATAAIRAFEAPEGRAPIPIIAVSANAMIHQVEDYIAKGMSGHVAKPVRKVELLAQIAKSLATLTVGEQDD